MFYTSASRGPVKIADMNYNHLVNAYDKLCAARKDDSRDAEIEAIKARIMEIDAEADADV